MSVSSRVYCLFVAAKQLTWLCNISCSLMYCVSAPLSQLVSLL